MLVASLRLVWILLTIYYEFYVFLVNARNCRWPDAQLGGPPSLHLLVVADPQLLDSHSYPERGALLTYLSRVFTDLNMRKSFSALQRLKPNYTLFLGDLMDGGRRDQTDPEYQAYYDRFKGIFHQRTVSPFSFIPGNHDVGLGESSSFSPAARSRYVSHFGPLNSYITLANHTFVLLDALHLAEEERQNERLPYTQWSTVSNGTVDFVKSLAGNIKEPVILCTHIPLFRSDGSYCGPHRERGTLRQGMGLGYQNELGYEASQLLLDTLKPSLVLSGDDHDYCEHNHRVTRVDAPVREVTVKSLSMAMGIRRPGVQLVSLASSVPSLADSLCLMPDQLGIYLGVYVPSILLSLLAVAVSNFRLPCWPRRSRNRYPATDKRLTLPLPVSHNVNWKWTFDMFGQRRGVRLHCCQFGCFETEQSAKQIRFLKRFVSDVRDIAIFPIGIFSAVTLWYCR